MRWFKIELKRRFNLKLTLYPSFTLAFYSVENSLYRKTIGLKGAFRVCDGEVYYYGFSLEEALELSGAWFDPLEKASSLTSRVYSRINPLLEAYESVGLAIDPYDKPWVFTTVVLSRTTDFHTNVLGWVKKLFLEAGDPRLIDEQVVSRVGGSFQLKQLPVQLRMFFLVREWRFSIDDSRIALQEIPGVGPKTATAYLLYTRPEASFLAPVDVHFKRFVRRLGILEFEFPWNPRLCGRYRCIECPGRGGCLHWKARVELGLLAGWLQTVSYIHDKLYCSRGFCSSCFLKNICTGLAT